MSNLLHFLTDLAVDPTKQNQFERDPYAMMEAAGLSEIDKIRLSSRERAKITVALANELQTDELIAVMGCCASLDPGPDPLPDPDPPDPQSIDRW